MYALSAARRNRRFNEFDPPNKSRAGVNWPGIFFGYGLFYDFIYLFWEKCGILLYIKRKTRELLIYVTDEGSPYQR